MKKKLSTYTRSTKLSLKFANKQKQKELNDLIDEYQALTQKFVDCFWCMDITKLPKFCDSKTYKIFDSFLGSYLRQSAGKQALGIVGGTFEKQKKRLFVYEKLLKENKFKQAKKLKKTIDEINMSCPKVKNIEIELGGNPTVTRFENSSNTFDSWLYLSLSKTNLNKSFIPLKKTKHYNKMIQKGDKQATGCRLSKNFVTLIFEFDKKIKTDGSILGVDIGSLNVVSCSDGQQTPSGLDVIQKKIARKRKGSKSYQRALIERENFVNWSINKLNLNNVSLVKRENIKNMKSGKTMSKFLTAWTYTDIFDKIDRYCEEQNVSVVKISPTYTSQRCSVCGWTRKSNRKGKVFKCTSCNHTEDADLNASKNISFNLPEMGKKERLSKINIKGFYWFEKGQELIVPDVKKVDN